MSPPNPLDLDRIEVEAPAFPAGTVIWLLLLGSVLLWLLIAAFILGITST